MRSADPGLNWKIPFIDSVDGRMSLRVNQIALTMETKTRDNVFVTIPISVQTRVRPEKVSTPITACPTRSRRSRPMSNRWCSAMFPGMSLDEVFASQASIASAVKQELDVDMAAFGYEIVNVLVTDIVPDAKVKAAMNDINAAQREQVAANARGEAEKILVVKKAEAEAESKALQGQGHRQPAPGDHRGPARLDRGFPEGARRRQRQGGDAACVGHPIFRYAEIHRRIQQDQHPVPLAFARLRCRPFPSRSSPRFPLRRTSRVNPRRTSASPTEDDHAKLRQYFRAVLA